MLYHPFVSFTDLLSFDSCDGGIDAQVQALSSKITVYCKILN